jgi:hypothetical protein
MIKMWFGAEITDRAWAIVRAEILAATVPRMRTTATSMSAETEQNRALLEARRLRSVRSIPVEIAATSRQMTAQLAAIFTLVLEVRVFDPRILGRSQYIDVVGSILGDRMIANALISSRDSDSAAGAALQVALDSWVHARLDAFQLACATHWRRLLRLASTAVATPLAGGVVEVAGGSALQVGAAALLGLVAGGPLSWFLRDVASLIGTRAAR